jgi:uncharacterized membrane protein YphA (DoxX/SURF4 family)
LFAPEPGTKLKLTMSTAAEWILLFGRILFVVFFADSALGHLRQPQARVAYARAYKMPLAYLGGWPAGIWLLGGSALVALGVWPDLGCLMLAAFVIPTAAVFHRYWEVGDATERMSQRLNFMRNVGLLGAALALFAFFAAFGQSLDLVLSGPLVHLR